MRNSLLGFILLIAVALLVVGCSDNGNANNTEPNDTNNNVTDGSENEGNNNEGNNEETDEPEEVTVSMMVHWSEKDFEKDFGQHIKEDLPHINLEYIQANGEEEIEQVFAKGIIPDIHVGSIGHAEKFELIRDQMPLVETYGLDLDLYEPNIIEALKNQSREGELNVLPFSKQGYVMTYNKDIFDAFGVPYPEDNMTWDEAIELGRQLSGERDGQQFHGIYPDRHALSQLSTTFVDPETEESNVLDNEELRLFLERTEAIFNIPGNLPDMDSVEELADYMYNGIGTDTIFEFALYPSRANANGHTWAAAEGGLDFDWVSYPVWGGEYPDYTPNEPSVLYVTEQSENPEAAFEVIGYLMSEKYQKWRTATGSSTPLMVEGIYDDFGTELVHAELMADKNKEALFKFEGAPIPEKSKYERTPDILSAYEWLLEGEDVNTVLRKLDEQLRAVIEEVKGRE